MHPDDLEHLENGGVQNASFLQEDHERISAGQLALFIGDTDWAYIQYALALDLTLARKQRDDARAELAAMRPVVEAAKLFIGRGGCIATLSRLDPTKEIIECDPRTWNALRSAVLDAYEKGEK